MNKTRKIIMSSIFIILSLFLLFVSIQERNKRIEESKPYQGYFLVNNKKIDFNEEYTPFRIEQTLKSDNDQITVALPIYRDQESWIVNRVSATVQESMIVDGENYILFTIQNPYQNITSLSFRKVTKKDIRRNLGEFDIPYSFEFNIEFEYENSNQFKNVFKENLAIIDSSTYYAKDNRLEICIKSKIDYNEEDEYADDYNMYITLMCGEEVIEIFNDSTWKLAHQYSWWTYLSEETAKYVEKGIEEGIARVEVEFSPTTNYKDKFSNGMMICKGEE